MGHKALFTVGKDKGVLMKDERIAEVAGWGTERLIPEWLERAWMESTGNTLNPVKEAVKISLGKGKSGAALCSTLFLLIVILMADVVLVMWASGYESAEDLTVFGVVLILSWVVIVMMSVSGHLMLAGFYEFSEPRSVETILQFHTDVIALAALCGFHLYGEKPRIGAGLFNSSKVSVLKSAEEGLKREAGGDVGIYNQQHVLVKRFLEIKAFDYYRRKKAV
jgi:hypothetical protein